MGSWVLPSLVLDLSIFCLFFLDFLIILLDFVDVAIDVHGGDVRFRCGPVPVQQLHLIRPVRLVRFQIGSVSGSRFGWRAS